MTDAPDSTGAPPRHRRRRGVRIFLLLLLACLIVAGWTVWRLLADTGSVSTDNAYVHGDLVVVTPRVAGTVVGLHTDETFWVSAGDPLVSLDDADARNALRHAEASLARTVREVRALYRGVDALRAAAAMQASEVERARAERIRTEQNHRRREALHQRGAVSSEDLQNARADRDRALGALAAAEAALASAHEEYEARWVLVEGVAPREHPLIAQAAAEMREAWLALQRTRIVAPVAGQVARRNVQLGQRVDAGANLMTLVPLDRLWVEANFKEGQLRDLRIGQPASVVADLYGNSVVYPARVVGFGAGTGASFSLLPAQNATGNWIKIVQRVPVRIEIDPQALKAHPLRVGLSMQVSVDTRDRDGPLLRPAAAGARAGPAAETGREAALLRAADAAVTQVVDRHLGEKPAGAVPNGRSPAKAAAH